LVGRSVEDADKGGGFRFDSAGDCFVFDVGEGDVENVLGGGFDEDEIAVEEDGVEGAWVLLVNVSPV
jgi:hypothetical protein